MFHFKFEPHIPMLTVTRSGFWTLDTVASYEVALRSELAQLRSSGRRTAFIIDIRSSGAQALDVADALRAMVGRLGPLHSDRTAVVTSSGLAKLQARSVADPAAQVFTSMVLARDWVLKDLEAAATVHNEPSDADAEGPAVHVHGPSGVDIIFTPAAALETAKRIGDAAVEALFDLTAAVPARKARTA